MGNKGKTLPLFCKIKGSVLNVEVVLINYGLAEQIRKAIIKVWSTFSKVVGVGKAHKFFPFTQSNDSQTAC
uniref:hypothetical protein n=1 Tax=Ruminococcus sp. TaxID=41978 RepID=UPI003AF67B61